MKNTRQMLRYGIWASAILLSLSQFQLFSKYINHIMNYELSPDINLAKVFAVALLAWVFFNYREEI